MGLEYQPYPDDPEKRQAIREALYRECRKYADTMYRRAHMSPQCSYQAPSKCETCPNGGEWCLCAHHEAVPEADDAAA